MCGFQNSFALVCDFSTQNKLFGTKNKVQLIPRPQGPHSQNFNDGGGGNSYYFYTQKNNNFRICLPKKTLLFSSIPQKKPLVWLFLQPQKILSCFFFHDQKKISASFIDPQKNTFGQNFRPMQKDHSEPSVIKKIM